MRRQRAACGLAARLLIQCCGGGLYGLLFSRGLVRCEIFQLQFELFDIAVEFLRTRAELHALQLEDQELQVFDLGLARIEFGSLSENERLQGLGTEGVEIGQLPFALAPVVPGVHIATLSRGHVNGMKIREHFREEMF
jgi:hypothetical protein